MSKRKLCLAVVPVLALATIVGAGFSLFDFGLKKEAQENVTVEVENYIGLDGELKITQAPTVTIDQKTPGGREATGTTANTEYIKMTAAFTITYTPASNEASFASSNLTIQYYWEVKSPLDGFIKTTTSAENPSDLLTWSGDPTTTSTVAFNGKVTQDRGAGNVITISNAAAENETFTPQNLTTELDYVTHTDSVIGEPNSTAEWGQLKSALSTTTGEGDSATTTSNLVLHLIATSDYAHSKLPTAGN